RRSRARGGGRRSPWSRRRSLGPHYPLPGSGLSPGDRPAENHHRRVERQLANLLGLTLAARDDGVVALLELRSERADGRLHARRVIRIPLRHGGVAGLVHANQSAHCLPPGTGLPSYADSSRSRISRVTSPPSARPLVSRMTKATSGPSALRLPARTCSAAAG